MRIRAAKGMVVFMMDDNALFMTEDQLDDEGREAQNEVQSDKYLIFVSDSLLFGVNAEYVVEIITNHVITHLPLLPEYVSGIMNLRGQIIPIMDIRLRMGKEPKQDCIVIVLNVEGTQIGILVDTVAQMEDIEKGVILPMPANSSMKLISGMCSLPDGGTMLVLDCELLLEI